MNFKANEVIHVEPGETLLGYKDIRPVPEKYIKELNDLFYRLDNQPGTLILKLKQLYALLNRFNNEFVSTFTACKKGCSACCKIDVRLTHFEAEYIAMATSIPHVTSTSSQGHKSACPFLSEKGTCSIYNYRPLFCRTYHVLSDPILCNDPDAQVLQYGVQKAGMGNFIYKSASEWIYFHTYHAFGHIEFRDIRDFFPYDRSDIQSFLKTNNPKPPC
ncbi:YkgJ family cysteine cluster protein [Aeromonas veronii]|uniref:YkgJ family cysteine cluster protein n=1 Tax=Aeromonas veronii TaxID=654 RepID=UPI001C5B5E5B|nr:YkgJ family cysteine cluster protein [Aeromonas veronii]MBW3779595.1 YkgJ family cysteine cluster protein [Aeromonas veronii]